MRRFVITGLLVSAISAPAFATVQFTSYQLAPNYVADTVLWGQLELGTLTPQTFSATSVNSLSVNGAFANNGGGTTCEVATNLICIWPQAAGFSLNEILLWAENPSNTGSGPLTLTFLPQFGGGAYLQSAGDLQFSAQLKAFNGNTLLGSNTVTSDALGNPLFFGVVDTTQEITGLEFSMTYCNSTVVACDATDFVIGTLTLYNGTPEPSTLLLTLGSLAALAFARGKFQK